MVYAGYGIVAPEYGWDDYAGLDVRGKLVLALVNDPGYATQNPQLFTGNAMTYYGRWDYKFAEAVRHGAAGLLVIHETKAAGYPWDVPRNGATKPQFDLRVADFASQRLALEGWIREDAAASVLAAAGMDYAALKKASSCKGSKACRRACARACPCATTCAKPPPITWSACCPAARDRTRPSSTPRTGTISARTPMRSRARTRCSTARRTTRRDLGADRTGASVRRDQAAAERSLLFVAVTAEESGLLGSQHFAENPPLPVAQMVGGLNMDNLYSVGKTRDMTVIGAGKSELEDDLARATAKQGRVPKPEPAPEKGFYYRSDHFNLAKVGVPMLYTKSGIDSPVHGADHGKRWLDDYTAKRYHQPSDEYSPGLGRERHAAGSAGVLRRGPRGRGFESLA